jgi:hypothetical protein
MERFPPWRGSDECDHAALNVSLLTTEHRLSEIFRTPMTRPGTMNPLELAIQLIEAENGAVVEVGTTSTTQALPGTSRSQPVRPDE